MDMNEEDKLTIKEAWKIVRDAAMANPDFLDGGPCSGRMLGFAIAQVEQAISGQTVLD
jgi:hypothetical protein